MPAKKTGYLSAHRLGISVNERKHLIAIMHHFRDPTARPEHVDSDDLTSDNIDTLPVPVQPDRPLGFSMSYSFGTPTLDERSKYHCGTAACIGGHVNLLAQGFTLEQLSTGKFALTVENQRIVEQYVPRHQDHPLRPLYYPPTDFSDSMPTGFTWDEITPQQAAQAIENFLLYKDPDWAEVMSA